MLLISRAMLLCYSLFIIIFSLLNFEQVSNVFNIWDKASHALAYCLFAMLAATSSQGKNQYIILLVLGLALGLSVEYFQGLTAHRTASIEDIYANMIGLFAGMSINLIFQQIGYHFFNTKQPNSGLTK